MSTHSQGRIALLLEAADELETHLQAKLDDLHELGMSMPAEECDEEAGRRLLRLIEAMQAVTLLLLADQKAEAGANG